MMMGKMKGFDKRALINELLEGKKYAKELSNQFSNQKSNNSASCSSSSSSSSLSLSSNTDDPNQAFDYSLLEKMLSAFDKTILIATSINNPDDLGQQQSPHSCISPKSENSHPDFPPSKKRKKLMRGWTKSVKISTDGVISGLQSELDDGYCWRKYGQKDILGAAFPRAYYRCTHQHTKGCIAKKQVQRSDEDPSTYRIRYKGDHTCNQGGLQVQAQSKPNNQAHIKPEPQPLPSPKDQEIYVGLGPEGELKVESQQQAESQAQLFRSLSFTSAFLDPEPIDSYMLSFNPSFGSPTTSGSEHHPVSPYQPPGPHVGLTVQTSETNSYEPLSGPNPFSNSPITSDFEFPIDEFQDIGHTFVSCFDSIM